MKSLYRTMDKNSFASAEDKARCRRCRSLREFDDKFTGPARGFPDSAAYYSQLSLEKNIPMIRVPTLVLGADNDPFIRPGSAPLKAARESANVAIVHVKEGGHVSLLTGWKGRKSLTDLVVPDWIEAIIANKLSR
jgi:predicted alpha/beta-fold hydrolase